MDDIGDIIGVTGNSFDTQDSIGIEELLAPESVRSAADWAYSRLVSLNEDLRSMLEEAKDLSAKKRLFDAVLQEDGQSGEREGSAGGPRQLQDDTATVGSAEAGAGRLISAQELASIGAEQLDDCAAQLRGNKLCWDSLVSLANQYSSWADQAFETFDFGTSMMTLKQTSQMLRKLPASSKRWPVKKSVDKMVNLMQKSLPICSDLRGEAIKQRHW